MEGPFDESIPDHWAWKRKGELGKRTAYRYDGALKKLLRNTVDIENPTQALSWIKNNKPKSARVYISTILKKLKIDNPHHRAIPIYQDEIKDSKK